MTGADEAEILANLVDEVIRPRVNVDGGDLRFDSLTGDVLHLIAGAECAVCPGCGEDFVWWIENELERHTGKRYSVAVTRKKPYYY